MPRLVVRSARATETFAARLALRGRGRVFALTGDLGSGKTTFVRGFLRAKGVRGRIVSPSFLVVRRYILRGPRFRAAYHIDAYRLRRPRRESAHLGMGTILRDTRAIVLIEWADKVRGMLPRGTRWIRFRHGPGKGRTVIF